MDDSSSLRSIATNRQERTFTHCVHTYIYLTVYTHAIFFLIKHIQFISLIYYVPRHHRAKHTEFLVATLPQPIPAFLPFLTFVDGRSVYVLTSLVTSATHHGRRRRYHQRRSRWTTATSVAMTAANRVGQRCWRQSLTLQQAEHHSLRCTFDAINVWCLSRQNSIK